MKTQFKNKADSNEYTNLLNQLNNIRSSQRRAFTSTEDYLQYGKQICAEKSAIFSKLELLGKKL